MSMPMLAWRGLGPARRTGSPPPATAEAVDGRGEVWAGVRLPPGSLSLVLLEEAGFEVAVDGWVDGFRFQT